MQVHVSPLILSRAPGWLLAAMLAVGCTSHPAASTEKPSHSRKSDGVVVLNGASAQFVKVEAATPATKPHSRTLVARVAFDERRLATIPLFNSLNIPFLTVKWEAFLDSAKTWDRNHIFEKSNVLT